MRRDITGVSGEAYDLVVIGGGVYGVCATWEAALRGLRVLLLERGDFGGATTANSLHTMHGGLRYLQHLDLGRMRESIRERREWMRLAPGLVTALPFLLPTFGHGLRGPEVMTVALMLNDLVAMDRNNGLATGAGLPRGRVLSRGQASEALSRLRVAGLNGAAIWYDALSHSPERLLMGLLTAAHDAGARSCNYAEVVGLLQARGQVSGVQVRDVLSGQQHELRTRCVLNTAGPWVDVVRSYLPAGQTGQTERLYHPSKGLNLVVRRLPFDTAIGVPVPRKGTDSDALLNKGSVTYFIMPWGRYSLIGTKHLHFSGDADGLRATRQEITGLLQEINPMLGDLALREQDVISVKCGLLPEQPGADAAADVVLQKHVRLVDHQQADGIRGLVSVIGVKWTTARAVAEDAVKLVCRQLGHGKTALPVEQRAVLPLRLMDESRVGAEDIIRAARDEMAVNLEDAIFRRTPLGFSDRLDATTIEQCADAMAQTCDWSHQERSNQIGLVNARLARMNEWRR